MSQLKSIETKPLYLRAGLHLLTYIEAVDKENPPLINIILPMGQVNSQVSFLFSDPQKEGFLTQPNEIVAVRVMGAPVELVIGIFASPDCKSPEIKLKTELLSPEKEDVKNQETPTLTAPTVEETLSSENKHPLAFSGHVQWQGDVQVAQGEALGNPQKNWRIESLAIHWPKKPEEIDIEYYCYVKTLGQSPKSILDQPTGTKARALPISALSAQLIGANADQYELTLQVIFSETGLRSLTANGELFSGLHENEYLTGIRGFVTRKEIKPEPVIKAPAPVENIWGESFVTAPTEAANVSENTEDDKSTTAPTEATNVSENIWDDQVATAPTEAANVSENTQDDKNITAPIEAANVSENIWDDQVITPANKGFTIQTRS
jgi:hypothetical protein